MKRFRRKLGFTLTELLISVLLLGFVSAMVTVMSTAILDTTVTMREVAEAEILGSEALDNLQGRLRVALNLKVDNEEQDVTFDLDGANQNYTFGIDEDGKIVLGQVPAEGDAFRGDLLFSGVSYGDLSVSELNFSGDEGKGTVAVSVEISFGEKILWSGGVTVRPLNGVTVG